MRFPLRVGVLILPDTPWQEARHVWQRADAWGFDHAWVYDHLTWRGHRDQAWFGAMPTLTAAAIGDLTDPHRPAGGSPHVSASTAVRQGADHPGRHQPGPADPGHRGGRHRMGLDHAGQRGVDVDRARRAVRRVRRADRSTVADAGLDRSGPPLLGHRGTHVPGCTPAAAHPVRASPRPDRTACGWQLDMGRPG